MIIILLRMNAVNEVVYFEDLRSFRWEIYHYRNDTERIKYLVRYYFKKYYFQHFAEEIVIAGYDLQHVRANQLANLNKTCNCSLTNGIINCS